MKNAPSIRLTVPAELRFRDVAIRALTAASRMVGRMDDESTSTGEQLDLQRAFDAQVVSAVSELFNNIAIHGFDRKGGGDVELEITPSRDGIEVVIIDRGRTFDISEVPAPQLDALPEGGMGIHIARACVDELEYIPGTPNIWRLKKQLNTEPKK